MPDPVTVSVSATRERVKVSVDTVREVVQIKVISDSYTLPTASADTLGGVKIGSGLTITAGVLSASGGGSYTLPVATGSVLGGIKSSTDILVDGNGVATVNASVFANLGIANVWTNDQQFNSYVNFISAIEFQSTAIFTYYGVSASIHRDALGLGSLATQSGTFSGTSSGTNTGDQTSIVGITGTISQFNTALTDGDFATLAGTETLTNKTISAPTISGAAQFTSTTRPTSAGTGTPAATSLITLTDADARYPRLYAVARATAATTTSSNTTMTDITGLSLTISETGIYRLSTFISATPANSSMGVKIGTIYSANTGTSSGVQMFTNNNSLSSANPYANATLNTAVDTRQISGGTNSQPAQLRHEIAINVTTAPVTVKIQFAQHTSNASNLTADIGNWMILEKLS